MGKCSRLPGFETSAHGRLTAVDVYKVDEKISNAAPEYAIVYIVAPRSGERRSEDRSCDAEPSREITQVRCDNQIIALLPF